MWCLYSNENIKIVSLIARIFSLSHDIAISYNLKWDTLFEAKLNKIVDIDK